MTQFTTTLPPLIKTTNSNSDSPWKKPLLGSTSSSEANNCMIEQLLLHCATAMESNDVTLAQQILWILHTISPSDGHPTQRLAASFLPSLTSRAAHSLSVIPTHTFTVTDLATFVDLTPRHRFGFTAANSAILHAIHGFSVIHFIDLSFTHCMQIPTLIDSLSSSSAVPPLIKLTVAAVKPLIPPLLNLPYDQLGKKLVNFARSKNVMMEFQVIPSTHADGYAALIHYLRVNYRNNPRHVTEALVINCHMMLHSIPDDETTLSDSSTSSLRSTFLKEVRSLEPTIVVLVEEDADLTWRDLGSRVRCAFNYFWIAYDNMETLVARGRKERQWYEADLRWKIDNVIAREGVERVERLESMKKWVHRMRDAAFQGISFGDDAVSEVKDMLDEHGGGWGFKEEDQLLLLTWKGHNVVFASAWLPATCYC